MSSVPSSEELKRLEREAAAVRDGINEQFALDEDVEDLSGQCWQAGEDLRAARNPQGVARKLLARLNAYLGVVAPAAALQFIDDAMIERLPPVSYLVDGIIPLGAACELHGPPESGKSFLALDIALCVASGNGFFRRPVKRAPVIYVAAEGSAGLGARVAAWKESRELAGQRLGVHFLAEPVALHEPAAIGRFVSHLGSIGAKPGLVVIDTLARCMPGADENSARDVGQAIAGIDRIRQASGGAVLVIHHTTKSGESERGSGALRGAMDAMIDVKRDGDALTVSCSKMKDGPHFNPLQLLLMPRLASRVLITADDRSAVVPENLTGKPLEALQLLQRLFEGGPTAASVWLKACGWSDRTFYDAAATLRERGYVTWRKEGKSKLYTVTDAGYATTARLRNNCNTPAMQSSRIDACTSGASLEARGSAVIGREDEYERQQERLALESGL